MNVSCLGYLIFLRYSWTSRSFSGPLRYSGEGVTNAVRIPQEGQACSSAPVCPAERLLARNVRMLMTIQWKLIAHHERQNACWQAIQKWKEEYGLLMIPNLPFSWIFSLQILHFISSDCCFCFASFSVWSWHWVKWAIIRIKFKLGRYLGADITCRDEGQIYDSVDNLNRANVCIWVHIDICRPLQTGRAIVH